MISTVFALSSGHGTCGVALIRITGPKAGKALLDMTGKSKLPKPRHATLAKLINPGSRQVLDQALTIWFPGPKSFTGEDSAAATRSIQPISFQIGITFACEDLSWDDTE